jgi:hypothetical protein
VTHHLGDHMTDDAPSRGPADLAAVIRYTEACRARNSAVVALLLMLPLLLPANRAQPAGRADLTLACVLGVLVAANLVRLGWKYLLMVRRDGVWLPFGHGGGVIGVTGPLFLLVQVPRTGDATAVVAFQPIAVLTLATGTACWVLWRERPSARPAIDPLPQPSGYRTTMTGDAPGGGPRFRGRAIACSGCGIRSAAFCLGALQRLRRPENGTSIYDGATGVYSVSGGNYTATALHLARRHSAAGVRGDLFQPGSPEEDWLRRRSKFLVASGGDLLRGTMSLVYGLVINVLLLGIAGYLLAWYLGWLHHRLPTLCGAAADAGCLERGAPAVVDAGGVPWGSGWWLLLVLAGPALFVVAKLLAKYVRRGRLPFRTATQVLVAAGLAAGALTSGLPWALAGLHDAAIAGEPAPVVARAMAAVDLVTPRACRDAARTDLRRAAAAAWARTPGAASGAAVPVTYGACGDTWTDDARVVAPGGVVPPAGADADPCRGPGATPPPAFCADLRGSGTPSPLERAASVAAGLLALAGAVRGFTGGVPGASSRFGKVLDVARRVVVPWLAVVALGVAAAVVLLLLVRDHLVRPGRLAEPGSLLAAVAGFGLIRMGTDAMLSSMHPFYRERLSDTFLVRRAPGGAAEPLGYDNLTPVVSVAEAPGPRLVVCCAANLSDRDFVPADRECAPFRFETGGGAADRDRPRPRIGISDRRLPGGALQPAEPYAVASDPEGLDTTLAATMAASGAAFSPLVGRMNARVRPYRVLLALGNARLGVWLPNPYLVGEGERWRQARGHEPAHLPEAEWKADRASAAVKLGRAWRRAWRPGPFRVLKEAFGRPSLFDGRLYVTDGGHYDNTGIVEALRDRPAEVFAIDASADPGDSLDALSQAIVTARMDLGLIVRPAPDSPATGIRTGDDQRPPEHGWLHLTVATVAEPDRTVCDIWFVKNVLTRTPNLELENYRRQNPAFPITSTGDQSYGEYDFEAYRLLGYLNTDAMLARRAAPGPAPAPGTAGVPHQPAPPSPAAPPVPVVIR